MQKDLDYTNIEHSMHMYYTTKHTSITQQISLEYKSRERLAPHRPTINRQIDQT
jgi:hypothetical protein